MTIKEGFLTESMNVRQYHKPWLLEHELEQCHALTIARRTNVNSAATIYTDRQLRAEPDKSNGAIEFKGGENA